MTVVYMAILQEGENEFNLPKFNLQKVDDLQNPRFHFYTHKGSPIEVIMSRHHPNSHTDANLFKIHSSTVFATTLRSPSCRFIRINFGSAPTSAVLAKFPLHPNLPEFITLSTVNDTSYTILHCEDFSISYYHPILCPNTRHVMCIWNDFSCVHPLKQEFTSHRHAVKQEILRNGRWLLNYS